MSACQLALALRPDLVSILMGADDLVGHGARPERLRQDALPWVWRRLQGRTAGDGRVAKHRGYVETLRPGADDLDHSTEGRPTG